MRRLTSLASLIALAAVAGCGNTVDHDSAVKVMNSALGATVAGDGQVVKADWTATGGDVDATLTNLAGSGSAHVTGSLHAVNGVVTTALDVSLTSWHDALANITLDGTLHEAGSFSAVAPLAGNVTLDGALAATGAVNATVDFDLQGSYSPIGFAIKGDVGGNGMSASFGVTGP